MVELEKGAFGKVLSLYQAGEIFFPLILAVVQEAQRGWVFVDDPDRPESAMVINNFGFMQTFGEERSESFDADVTNFFTAQNEHMPTYLLWYSPPLSWQEKLDDFVPVRVRRRIRVRFKFVERLAGDISECPQGYNIQLLNKDLIAKTNGLNLSIGSRFWASMDDFLENGLGVCLVKDGEVLSLCYSACVVDGLAEIDIVTSVEYRGQGLATVVAQHFIRECIQRGLQPTWDCFVSNTASMKLAKKLGFAQTETYPFYSFTIPIVFPEKAVAI